MATDTSISNMALGHVKSSTALSSLELDKSKEATKCRLYFAQARDETLEEFNWPFAKRSETLALTGDAPLGWAFQYAYPAEAVAIRKIRTTYRDDEPVPFELAHSELGDAIVILTDCEAAVVEYTKRITNPTLFSPLFTTAFSYKLASYIALPITGKRELRKDALELYGFELSKARTSALNQGQKDEEPLPSWLSGR